MRVLEFKTFRFPVTGTAARVLPIIAGDVRYDPAGMPALLHVGAGWFLIPAPSAELETSLAALVAMGVGAIFDVTGKWRRMFSGINATEYLSTAFDVTMVLSNRDCAAISVLDCPSIVVRRGVGSVMTGEEVRGAGPGSAEFDLWVQRSYALQ